MSGIWVSLQQYTVLPVLYRDGVLCLTFGKISWFDVFFRFNAVKIMTIVKKSVILNIMTGAGLKGLFVVQGYHADRL